MIDETQCNLNLYFINELKTPLAAGLILEEIFEIIITIISVGIYGTEDRPRHPAWRNIVRVVAFGGVPVAAAGMLSWLGQIEIPLFAIIPWIVCSLIVLSAEYYAGSKRVAMVAVMCFVLLLGLAVATFYIS